MSERTRTTAKPVVLSYGLGVDSSAILVRWIVEPSSRDFDLSDLIVVTAQVGDEFAETIDLVERYVFPMLRAAGVRFVELARKGRSQKGGRYKVLQDTRSPERLHPDGGYKLSDEMLASGTVPQSGGGHLCSIKSKATPIEAWLANEFGSTTRRHVMGYSAEEGRRIRKDVVARATTGTLDTEATAAFRIVFGFSSEEERRIEKAERVRAEKGQAKAEFPLATWDWDRETSIAFLREQTGATWPKSACVFCPFSCGRREVLDRYREHPDETVLGLTMEATAIALNPRAKLFKSKSLLEVLTADGNQAALDLFEAAIADTTWALYRVRRRFSGRSDGKTNVARSVEILETGTRDELAELLADHAARWDAKVERDHAIERFHVQAFDEKVDGAQEEILAIAPATAQAKAPRFDEALWIPAPAR